MKTETVIAALVGLIKPACPAVYFQSPSPVQYPKAVGDLRQLTDSGYSAVFRLVLDIWLDSGDPIEAHALADNIRARLTDQKGTAEGGFISVYAEGSRYAVPEKDNNKIVHLVESYAVYFYRDKED